MYAVALPATVLRDVSGLPAGSRALLLPLDEPIVDRFAVQLAYQAVLAATRLRRSQVVLAVCGACPLCDAYEIAVAAAAAIERIGITLFTPAGPETTASQTGKAASDPPARVSLDRRLIDGTYVDAVLASKHHAATIGAADGNVPGPYANHGHFPLAVHVVDVLGTLPEPPTALWMPLDDTCIAVDAALRMMGWPTTLYAVTPHTLHPVPAAPPKHAATAPTGAGPAPGAWPVSVLEPYLGDRRADNQIVQVGTGHVMHAQRLLDSADINTTPSGGLGLAGLLAAHDGEKADNHLVLITLSWATVADQSARDPGTDSP